MGSHWHHKRISLYRYLVYLKHNLRRGRILHDTSPSLQLFMDCVLVFGWFITIHYVHAQPMPCKGYASNIMRKLVIYDTESHTKSLRRVYSEVAWQEVYTKLQSFEEMPVASGPDFWSSPSQEYPDGTICRKLYPSICLVWEPYVSLVLCEMPARSGIRERNFSILLYHYSQSTISSSSGMLLA